MARIGENISAAGYVPQSIRRRSNIEVYSKALDKIDAAHKEALDQITAINAAIGQLELNEAEDEFRLNYINKVKNELDKYATHGNYSGALDAAKQAAANILTDPAIRGRIKYQQEYKKQLDQIQNNPNLNQVTKDRWMEENPYNYQDKYDSSGNVIGGSSWKNQWTPVNRVDMSEIASRALSWVKPDTYTGNGKAMFVNSAGEFTTDMSDAVDIAWQTESSTTKLGPEKLKQAIETAINMTPGAAESLKQDFTDDNWQYNKLSDEEKENMNGSAVTDTNGQPLTFEQYVAKKINPWANVASYNQTTSKTTYHDGFKTAYALKNQNKATEYGNSVYASGLSKGASTYGNPITVDNTDYLNSANADIKDAIKEIEKQLPVLANTKDWQEAKSRNDFDTLKKLVGNSSKNQKISDAIRVIDDNKDIVNRMYEVLSDDEVNAIFTENALKGGTKLPEGKWSKKLYNNLNKFGKNAKTFKVHFSNTNALNRLYENTGINEQGWKDRGVEISYNNGKPIMSISKNNDAIFTLLGNISHLGTYLGNRYGQANTIDDITNDANSFWGGVGNFFKRAGHGVTQLAKNYGLSLNKVSDAASVVDWLLGSTVIESLDDNGKRLRIIDPNDMPMRWIADNFYDINKVANVSASNKINSGLSSVTQTRKMDLPNTARVLLNDPTNYTEIAKARKEDNDYLSYVLGQGSDYSQYSLYAFDENTNTLTPISNKEKNELMPYIKAKINKNQAGGFFLTNYIDTGYGIELFNDVDSKGNEVKNDKNRTYFIAAGIEDTELNKFKRDSNVRSKGIYAKKIGFNGQYTPYLDNTITNINNNYAIQNGKQISQEFAEKQIECDIVIDDAVNYVKSTYENLDKDGKIQLANALSESVIQQLFTRVLNIPYQPLIENDSEDIAHFKIKIKDVINRQLNK